MSATNIANGIKQKTKHAIAQQLVNINQKINTLDSLIPSEDRQIKRLREMQRNLINGLQILAITRLQALESKPGINQLIAGLGARADTAKKEAERLKNTAERLAAFEEMLGNIVKLVSGIVRLAA